jgi:hypothetical protein
MLNIARTLSRQALFHSRSLGHVNATSRILMSRTFATEATSTSKQEEKTEEDLVGAFNRRQTIDILQQGISITTPPMPLTDLVNALRTLDREKPSTSQVDVESLIRSHEEHSPAVEKRAIVHIPEPRDNPESATVPTSKAALQMQQQRTENAYNEQVFAHVIRERMEEKKKLEEMLERPDLDPQMRDAIVRTFAILKDFDTMFEKQLQHQRNVTGIIELSDEAIARAANFTIAELNKTRPRNTGSRHDENASWTMILGYTLIFAIAGLVTMGLAVPGFRHYIYNPVRDLFESKT